MLNVRRNISLVEHSKNGNKYSAENKENPSMFLAPLLTSGIN
jgi:hypothetical protein